MVGAVDLAPEMSGRMSFRMERSGKRNLGCYGYELGAAWALDSANTVRRCARNDIQLPLALPFHNTQVPVARNFQAIKAENANNQGAFSVN